MNLDYKDYNLERFLRNTTWQIAWRKEKLSCQKKILGKIFTGISKFMFFKVHLFFVTYLLLGAYKRTNSSATFVKDFSVGFKLLGNF